MDNALSSCQQDHDALEQCVNSATQRCLVSMQLIYHTHLLHCTCTHVNVHCNNAWIRKRSCPTSELYDVLCAPMPMTTEPQTRRRRHRPETRIVHASYP